MSRLREFLLERGFSPVCRESYAVFKTFDTGGRQFHELTATVSTIWAFAFDAVYKIIDGFLCSVWFYRSGDLYFYIQRPPRAAATGGEAGNSDSAGNGDSVDGGDALRRIIGEFRALARGMGLDALRIWAVDEALLAALRAAVETGAATGVRAVAGAEALPGGGAFSAECSGDYSEYVYRVADILEWNGGANLNKRNSLKRCFSVPDVSLRPLEAGNFARCFEVEDEWCRRQDCDACRAFAGCARDSLKNMEGIFDASVYGGFLLYAAGKPEGYAIWELLGGTAYVYFAKANIPNFNVYLYYCMAKDRLGEAEFLNNGYDMGKPGLRMFKRHLGAHRMLKKYLVTLG
jgi:hypothetical protein